MSRRPHAFTLTDLLALLAIGAVLLSITPASAWRSRTVAQQMQNNTQLRGQHQALVIYAQSNKGHFAGLDHTGEIRPGDQIPYRASDGSHMGSRLAILLDANFFMPDYTINPRDKEAEPFGEEVARGRFELPEDLKDVEKDSFNEKHYSHAGLEIGEAGPRRDEWCETINSLAPVMGDRNTGPDVDEKISSLWTKHASGEWHGSVVFNDNHVKLLKSPVVEETRFGDNEAGKNDHLFKAEGKADVLLTFLKDDEGNETRAKRDRNLDKD